MALTETLPRRLLDGGRGDRGEDDDGRGRSTDLGCGQHRVDAARTQCAAVASAWLRRVAEVRTPVADGVVQISGRDPQDPRDGRSSQAWSRRASTGNHGLAVAYAARAARAPARIFVPDAIAPAKAEAIRALGADLVLIKGGALEAERLAREEAAVRGLTYISPYSDPDVIAGHSVIGHEIMRQAPQVDAIFVAVGGGGLLAGVGAAAKSLKPSVKMIGCWPANAASLYECLETGALHHVEERPTISDATAGGVEPGSITFELCRAVVDEKVLVTEPEIASAMRQVAEHAQWIVEGAAGVAIAGMMRCAPHFTGRTVAVVLCGRNIGWPDFLQAVNGVE